MGDVLDIGAREAEIDRLLRDWPRAPKETVQIKIFIGFLAKTDLGRKTLQNLGLEYLLEDMEKTADDYEKNLVPRYNEEIAILEAFNDTYFVINDGTLEAITMDQINERFSGEPKDWPHLFITTRDNRVDPGLIVNNMLAAPEIAKAAGMKGDVLAIGAYYSDVNAANNILRTLRRVHELGSGASAHEHVSDAAHMVSELIQKLAAHTKKPDALMNNLTLYGFSEGGNIVTDAARLLRESNLAQFLPRARSLLVAPSEVHYSREELASMPPRMRIRRPEDAVQRAFGSPFTLDTERDQCIMLETNPERAKELGHNVRRYEQDMRANPDIVAKIAHHLVGSRAQQRGANLG